MYIRAADHIIICNAKTDPENLIPNIKLIIGSANKVIISATNIPMKNRYLVDLA
jgi:hypothetical protein